MLGLTTTSTEEALGRHDLGTPLLSLSLPVGTQHYTQGVVRPFLDGLLPEPKAAGASAGGINGVLLGKALTEGADPRRSSAGWGESVPISP